MLLIDLCIMILVVIYCFWKFCLFFFFRIVVKKKMYGVKSWLLRFFIVLLYIFWFVNFFVFIVVYKIYRCWNWEGFLLCCYIFGFYCFIKDWIVFILDCFWIFNVCGKWLELMKYGIIIKEVNNIIWFVFFIWYYNDLLE